MVSATVREHRSVCGLRANQPSRSLLSFLALCTAIQYTSLLGNDRA